MPSATEFLDKISQIVGDDISDGDIKLNLRWENREEGKQVLAHIRAMQAELRQLKKEVAFEASSIRSAYTSKRTAVGKSFTAGLAGAFFGRRTVGAFNAARRDDFRCEQLAAVEPYERVKGIIDEVIHRLNEVKARVESSEEYSIKPSSPPRGAQAKQGEQSRKYFVRLGTEVKGPFSPEQVKGLMVAGLVTLDSEVQIEGIDAWIKLSAVEEFARFKIGG